MKKQTVPEQLIRTPSDEQAIKDGCFYDPQAAKKARYFLETFCVLSKAPWAGKPLKLQPWQWERIIAPLYGWKKPSQERRHSKAQLWCAKKSGKSSLLSGLAILHLLEQPGSEVLILAGTKEQAGCIYKETCNMVEASPHLAKRLWVRRNINAIQFKEQKSELRILSSEPRNAAGHNPTTVFYDELASWGAHAREIWDHLQPSTIARKNALHFVIGHAGFDLSTVGHEQFQYALGVQNGEIIDTSLLPAVFTIPQELDWQDEKNWPLANPSLGYTVSLEALREQYQTVKNNPLEEARFRTLNCNQFVGSAESWISASTWNALGDDTLKEEDFLGCECTVGIDLSRTTDLTAYVLTFQRDGKYYIFPRFFIPGDTARLKEKKDKVPYTRWAENPSNNLFLTDGDRIDGTNIVNAIVADSKKYRFLEVGFDPYGMELIRQTLEYDHGLPMVEVTQSPSVMAEPIEQFHRLVMDEKLVHPNNPILNWNMENTRPRERNEKVMLEKANDTARIDGVIASVISVYRSLFFDGGDTLMPFLL